MNPSSADTDVNVIFIDTIAEILQPSTEIKKIYRVVRQLNISVDYCIVCATNKPL